MSASRTTANDHTAPHRVIGRAARPPLFVDRPLPPPRPAQTGGLDDDLVLRRRRHPPVPRRLPRHPRQPPALAAHPARRIGLAHRPADPRPPSRRRPALASPTQQSDRTPRPGRPPPGRPRRRRARPDRRAAAAGPRRAPAGVWTPAGLAGAVRPALLGGHGPRHAGVAAARPPRRAVAAGPGRRLPAHPPRHHRRATPLAAGRAQRAARVRTGAAPTSAPPGREARRVALSPDRQLLPPRWTGLG